MFEVGKDALCIQSGSTGSVTIEKNKTYIVYGIRVCRVCNVIMLDIGFSVMADGLKCQCGDFIGGKGSTAWVNSKYFVPIDNTLSSLTLEQLLNETVEV